MLALTLALGALSTACTAPRTPELTAPGPWTVEVLFQAPSKLGACAVGDLDPSRPGPEVAAVSDTGEVWVIGRTGDRWEGEVAFRAPGEMIQCAIGDADPSRPGVELVVCGIAKGREEGGGPGAAWLVAKDGRGWTGELLLEDKALLHAICVAEGGVVTAGFGGAVHFLVRDGDAWSATRIADLGGAAKCAVPYRNGAVLTVTDGQLLHVVHGGGGWTSDVLDRREAPRARLFASNGKIAVGDDDGTLSILGEAGRERVFRATSKLRGAVIGDLDPRAAGLEAASAGYDATLRVHYLEGGTWRSQELFKDVDRFHHLTAADVDGKPGLELVACGYPGRIVLVTSGQ